MRPYPSQAPVLPHNHLWSALLWDVTRIGWECKLQSLSAGSRDCLLLFHVSKKAEKLFDLIHSVISCLIQTNSKLCSDINEIIIAFFIRYTVVLLYFSAWQKLNMRHDTEKRNRSQTMQWNHCCAIKTKEKQSKENKASNRFHISYPL